MRFVQDTTILVPHYRCQLEQLGGVSPNCPASIFLTPRLMNLRNTRCQQAIPFATFPRGQGRAVMRRVFIRILKTLSDLDDFLRE